jgi:hypothetical protein
MEHNRATVRSNVLMRSLIWVSSGETERIEETTGSGRMPERDPVVR